jgi:peptidoglycan-associated lipoprotein
MKRKALAVLAAVTLASLAGTGCAKKVAVMDKPAVPRSEPAAAPIAARQEPQRVAPQTPQQPATTKPATSTPSAETQARIQDLLNRIQDAYFDYNEQNIRPDAAKTLRVDADALALILRQYPDYKLTVEGYCDERGSEEYNLALGDARAKRARGFLGESGIPESQIRIVSYGKERQVCGDHSEGCWQKNRRVHISQTQ